MFLWDQCNEITLMAVFSISFIVRKQLKILDCLYSVASLGIRICV